MLNFERYKKEIKEITEKGVRVAVVNSKPKNCHETYCTGCDLYEFGGCAVNFIKWLYEEYQEPKPKLTRTEKEFVKCFKFKKDISIWRDGAGYIWLIDEESNIQLDDNIFEFIKKGQIWSIDSLDKLEVEENA